MTEDSVPLIIKHKLPIKEQPNMTNVFDITDFGAIGDEKTDCTATIQQVLTARAYDCMFC